MYPINPEFMQEVHDWSEAQGFWKKESNNEQTVLAMSKLALVHTEVSEATEEVRRGKLLHQDCAFELADVVIRVMNFCTHYGIDLNQAILDKHQVNLGRKILEEHGKQL